MNNQHINVSKRLKKIKIHKINHKQKVQQRKELASSVPTHGKIRAKQAAAYLGIAISTFYKYVSIGLIKRPIKFNARIAVWDAQYIIEIGENGLSDKTRGAA